MTRPHEIVISVLLADCPLADFDKAKSYVEKARIAKPCGLASSQTGPEYCQQFYVN